MARQRMSNEFDWQEEERREDDPQLSIMGVVTTILFKTMDMMRIMVTTPTGACVFIVMSGATLSFLDSIFKGLGLNPKVSIPNVLTVIPGLEILKPLFPQIKNLTEDIRPLSEHMIRAGLIALPISVATPALSTALSSLLTKK